MNSTPLSRITQTLTATAVIFGGWAATRLTLICWWSNEVESGVGAAQEHLLRYISDVEIHSLHFRAGYDLLFLPVIGLLVYVAAGGRGRWDRFGSIVIATAIAGVLGVAMMYYPALTLSGRMSSPFVGIQRGRDESVAFAVVVVTIIVVGAGIVHLCGRALARRAPADRNFS